MAGRDATSVHPHLGAFSSGRTGAPLRCTPNPLQAFPTGEWGKKRATGFCNRLDFALPVNASIMHVGNERSLRHDFQRAAIKSPPIHFSAGIIVFFLLSRFFLLIQM